MSEGSFRLRIHRIVLSIALLMAISDAVFQISSVAESGISAKWNMSNSGFVFPSPPPATWFDHAINVSAFACPIGFVVALLASIVSAASWRWARWIIAVCCVETLALFTYVRLVEMIGSSGAGWSLRFAYMDQIIFVDSFPAFLLIWCFQRRWSEPAFSPGFPLDEELT